MQIMLMFYASLIYASSRFMLMFYASLVYASLFVSQGLCSCFMLLLTLFSELSTKSLLDSRSVEFSCTFSHLLKGFYSLSGTMLPLSEISKIKKQNNKILFFAPLMWKHGMLIRGLLS